MVTPCFNFRSLVSGVHLVCPVEYYITIILINTTNIYRTLQNRFFFLKLRLHHTRDTTWCDTTFKILTEFCFLVKLSFRCCMFFSVYHFTVVLRSANTDSNWRYLDSSDRLEQQQPAIPSSQSNVCQVSKSIHCSFTTARTKYQISISFLPQTSQFHYF